TVRDRRFERRLDGGSRGIDVDPLRVAGGGGELIDALLRDLEPVADRDFLADASLKRTDVVDLNHLDVAQGFGPAIDAALKRCATFYRVKPAAFGNELLE